METTTFENKCFILSEVWMDYRDSDQMADFFDYFDLAFPLAFAETEGVAKLTEIGQVMIGECWSSLLVSLGVKEDTGFASLSEMIGIRDMLDGNQDE
jgi:hypothetical protein